MGMSVTISVATERDAEQIFRLQYLCFQSEAALYGNYRIEPLVEHLDSVQAAVASDSVFVARLGDEVVGSVRGSVRARDAKGEAGGADAVEATDDTGLIEKVCVHPRLQGHGIGARLLHAVEGALAERGAKRYRLLTGHRSDANVRLYQREGYERVGTDEAGDGVPMIVLEKQATAVPAGTETYAATA